MSDTTSTSRRFRDWIGRSVGAFLIEGVVGAGGMGIVLRAREPGGRLVALKVLACDIDPEITERFDRERRVLELLDHASIVRIFSSGRLPDGEHYYAMELRAEPSLRQLLDQRRAEARGPFGPREIKALMEPLLDVLHVLHSRQVFHRDIKPGNLLVSDALFPVLIDFGLVGMVESQLTASGTILGSMTYLSPEQAGARRVDARSDLFQVGMVAYEMLTLKPVYAEPLAFFGRLATGEEPIDYPRSLSNAWVQFLRRALARDPDRRHSSALAMKEALLLLPDDASSGESLRLGGRKTLRWHCGAAAAVLAVVATGVLLVRHRIEPVRIVSQRLIRGIHSTVLEAELDRPAHLWLTFPGSTEHAATSLSSAEGSLVRFELPGPETVTTVVVEGAADPCRITIPPGPSTILYALQIRSQGNDLSYRWRSSVCLAARLRLRSASGLQSSTVSRPTTSAAGLLRSTGVVQGSIQLSATSELGEEWESCWFHPVWRAGVWQSLVTDARDRGPER